MAATPEELLAHAGWIRALARGLVADPSLAEDVAQDTWVAALEQPPAGDRPLRPWLAQVARNFARQRGRGEARRERREQAAAAEELPTPAALVERVHTQQHVVQAVLRLREPHRSTVLLHYFEELSLEEIARREDAAAATVRKRHQRALEALRAELDGAFGDRRRWALALGQLLGAPEAAPQAPRAATAAAAAGGALFMKQAVIAVGIVGVVGLGVWWWQGAADPVPRGLGGNAPPSAAVPVAAGAAEVRPDPPARQAVPEGPAPAAATAPAQRLVLAGGFLQENGAPVADVRVFGWDADCAEDQPLARSDAAGRIEVELPADYGEHGRASFRCLHSDFATVVVHPHAESPQRWQFGTVRLRAGGSIEGQVVDAEGAPVVGALVTAEPPEPVVDGQTIGSLMSGMSGDQVSMTTPGDGRFLLAGVPAGPGRVSVVAPGFARFASEIVEVPARDTRGGLRLELRREAHHAGIRGRLLDPDGAPIGQARLKARWTGVSWYGSTTTEGEFAIEVPPGEAAMVRFEDRAGAFTPLVLPQVLAGGPELTVQLRPQRSMIVDVFGPGEAPLPRFTCKLWIPAGAEAEPLEFSSQGLASGGRVQVPQQEFALSVLADGFAEARVAPLRAETAPERLRVDLRPLPGIRGVVRAQGQPLPGVRVDLYRVLAEDQLHVIEQRYVSELDRKRVAYATSDAAGEFMLTLREPGRFVLRTVHESYAATVSPSLELDPARGADGLVLEVGAGGTVRGRLLLPEGESPAGRVVSAHRGDSWPRTTRTAADGSFEFARLTPGAWRIEPADQELGGVVSGETYGGTRRRRFSGTVSVAEGATAELVLDLRAPVRLRGFLAVDGEPAEDWSAQLLRDAGGLPVLGLPATEFVAGGEFRLSAGHPGDYYVLLHAPGSVPGLAGLFLLAPVSLGPGETAWNFELGCGGTRGTVGPETRARRELRFLYWTDGTVEACAFLPAASEGELAVPQFPAGWVKLVAAPSLALLPDRARWRTLAEFALPQGGEGEFALP